MEASARSQIQPIKTAAISKCYTMKASRFQKSRASNPFQKKKKTLQEVNILRGMCSKIANQFM